MSHALACLTSCFTRKWNSICLQTLIRKVVSLKEAFCAYIIMHLKQKKINKKISLQHQIVIFATCYKHTTFLLDSQLLQFLLVSALEFSLQVPFYTIYVLVCLFLFSLRLKATRSPSWNGWMSSV